MAATVKKNDIPLFFSPVSAGFPGVAEERIESTLDLNEYCIKHPAATFFVRSSGLSMVGVGIGDGDVLVVDRSLEPRNNSIVIALVDGSFTVKRIIKRKGEISLMPENPMFPPIRITGEMDFEVWGVVTHAVKKYT
jgi:DNA polymerase V